MLADATFAQSVRDWPNELETSRHASADELGKRCNGDVLALAAVTADRANE